MKLAVSTFKFGLPWDNNGIYNDLNRRAPRTFKDLLARLDEFPRDDDRAVNMLNSNRDKGNDRKVKGSGNKNKRDGQE